MSLETQQQQITGYAMMKGWKITEFFVEPGVSGSVPLADREQGQRLLAAVLCHLIVVEVCNGKFGWWGAKPIIGSIVFAIAITISLEAPLDRFRQARIQRFMRPTHEPNEAAAAA